MAVKKENIWFYISLACAIWFLLTGSVWVYLMNLVVSLPIGIISYVMMNKVKAMEGRTKRVRLIEIILIIAVLISFVVLMGLLITN